jgi:phosphotransferase system HPr (HPr) family protein
VTIGTPLRRSVVVANPNGLHMRPATRFAQHARLLPHRVSVCHGDRRADGKSSLDLLMLIAMPGTELWVEVEGDEQADDETLRALRALCDILASPGDDN